MNEIAEYLRSVPELTALVDAEAVDELINAPSEDSLRKFFHSFVYAEKEAIAAQLKTLCSRLEAQQGAKPLSNLEQLVLRLHDEYQDDIGCFCPFILNYVTLKPGEALYLGANEPHAYLSGDCMECMAGSDNVVRAGLTPKFIDKETLHKMLTYRAGLPAITSGERVDSVTRIYTPPVPEFEVEAIEVVSEQKYTPSVRTGASILLIVAGEGVATTQHDRYDLARGRVFFLPAGEQVELEASSNLTIFRASPNEHLIEGSS